MATLYVVATPIGNLEDLSLRAIRLLEQSPVVACEDSRVTRKIFSHLGIPVNRMIPLSAYATPKSISAVIDALSSENDVVLVSDAGTPGIADPGAEVVRAVRQELPNTAVMAVPGPSAVAAALSISGINADQYYFAGFPPHKKGRSTFFSDISIRAEAVVLFESPHRIDKALQALEAHMPERPILVCRELTKRFETTLSGTPAALRERIANDRNEARGEFVLIIPPSPK